MMILSVILIYENQRKMVYVILLLKDYIQRVVYLLKLFVMRSEMNQLMVLLSIDMGKLIFQRKVQQMNFFSKIPGKL